MRPFKIAILIFLILGLCGLGARATELCPPGQELSSTAFACVPASGKNGGGASGQVSGNRAAQNAATALSAAAALLNIISVLSDMIDSSSNEARGSLEIVYAERNRQEARAVLGRLAQEKSEEARTLFGQGNYAAAVLAYEDARRMAEGAQQFELQKVYGRNVNRIHSVEHLQAVNGYIDKGDLEAASASLARALNNARFAEDEALENQITELYSALLALERRQGGDAEQVKDTESCPIINGEVMCH